MTENINNEEVNKGFFKKLIENPWIRICLEIIAFILLVSKLIPANWLKNEWPFLVVIFSALIGLIYTNYKITNRLISEINLKKLEIERITSPLEKKSRYADIIPMLNDAFQELHTALRKDFSDKSKYHEPFVVFCHTLEKVFNHITGVECHVCIKVTLFPKGQIPNSSQMNKILNNLQVKTYCRSSSASSSRKQIDTKSVTHMVNENTDFESVFRGKDSCFFCSDLAQIDDYKNSSFKPLNGSYSYFPSGTPYETKVQTWPLNYRATIVVPIIPIIKEQKEDYNILGLLCVDSIRPNSFNDSVDKHIMIGCADGIYNSFKKLFPITKN